MEKFIHTLGNDTTNYMCSALYKNVAVAYGDATEAGQGFFFYDIGTRRHRD